MLTEIPLLPDKIYRPEFTQKANEYIRLLNKYIGIFKKTDDPLVKKDILGKLLIIYKHLEKNINTYDIEECQDYQQAINKTFFSQLITEMKQNGIEETITPIQSAPSSATLAKIISRMSTEHLTILHMGLRDKIIHNPFKPDDAQYQLFEEFLANHQIVFLRGGNSLNYKITPNDGSKPYVIKLENHIGYKNPQMIEERLAEKIPGAFASKAISRQSIANDDQTQNVRFISVSEYCANGDVLSYSHKNSNLESAVDIFLQMAEIISQISHENCVFPDMKNANWLLTDELKLKIADTKSLLETNAGKIDIEKNERDSLCVTPFVAPPETSNINKGEKDFNADQYHAFILGKNIYEFISKCSWVYLDSRKDARDFHYSLAKFKGNDGQAFESLIYNLVNLNPKDRISVTEAIEKLKSIKKMQLVDAITALNSKLPPEQQKSIQQDDSLQQMQTIKDELMLKVEKEECKILLSDLPADVQIQQAIAEADSIENLQPIKQNLTKIICDKLQVECVNIMKELRGKVPKSDISIDEFISCQSIKQWSELKHKLELRLSANDSIKLLNELGQSNNKDVQQYVQTTRKKISECKTIDEIKALEKDIKCIHVHNKCFVTLSEVKASGFGVKDEKMNQFCESYHKKISEVDTIEAAQNLSDELEKISEQLHNPIIEAVQSTITDLRTENGYGMAEKASRIENAATQLGIDARRQIMTKDSKTIDSELHEVLRQMASHRHLFISGTVYEKENGVIDEEKAASTFTKFKKQLNKITEKNQDEPQPTNLKK